jgi:hypothetical protein
MFSIILPQARQPAMSASAAFRHCSPIHAKANMSAMNAEIPRTPKPHGMALRISLFTFAALLMGAHFVRAGSLSLAALCVGIPLLFLHRRRVSLIALQVLAFSRHVTWRIAPGRSRWSFWRRSPFLPWVRDFSSTQAR